MFEYNLSNTKALLDKYNLKAKISLGQNFLVDPKVVNKIIKTINKQASVAIVEVGAGLGALSSQLLEVCDRLITIEIDQNMCEILNDLITSDKFSVINEDILNVDLESLVEALKVDYEHVYLVANLPYYITSQILLKTFVMEHNFDLIMVMVQHEFALRLNSEYQSKAYRPLSVVGQTFYKLKLLFNISKNVFYPKPNVVSTIVEIKRNDFNLKDKKAYLDFVEICFKMKRKTIYNNLRSIYDEDFVLSIFKKSGLDRNLRPADLKIEDYVRLYEVYNEEKIVCEA